MKQSESRNIQEYQSPSGLRLIHEGRAGSQAIYITIICEVGSRNDPAGLSGISSLLAQTIPRGSKNYPEGEEALFDIGTEMAPTVARDYVIYNVVMRKDTLPLSLPIISDFLHNPSFESLAASKKLTLGLIREKKDEPRSIAHQFLLDSALPGQSYATPLLGKEKDLERITVDDLKTHLAREYRDDKTVIAIHGNVEKTLIKQILKEFSETNIQNKERGKNKRKAKKQKSSKLTPKKGHAYLEKDFSQYYLHFYLEGLSYSEEADPAYHLLADIIYYHYLWEKIRQEEGLVYAAMWNNIAFREGGLLCLEAITSPKNLEQIAESVAAIGKDILKRGISDKSFLRAQKVLQSNVVFAEDSGAERSNSLAYRCLFDLPQQSIAEEIKSLSRVKKDELLHLADKLLAEKEWSLAATGPTTEERGQKK